MYALEKYLRELFPSAAPPNKALPKTLKTDEITFDLVIPEKLLMVEDHVKRFYLQRGYSYQELPIAQVFSKKEHTFIVVVSEQSGYFRISVAIN